MHQDITAYLSASIDTLVADVIKAALKNPKAASFLLRYRAASRRSAGLRAAHEASGRHIPPFLIASIADECNLLCAGCYARAGGGCGGQARAQALSAEAWRRIFDQAAQAGVSFILLAGGEPLLRRDVLAQAAQIDQILFPVFTNGTLIDGDLIDLFDRHRNLIPVLSIEGGRERTDRRRGPGTHEKLVRAMEALAKRRILFGASATVTSENLDEVASIPFAQWLRSLGCRLLFHIEYVPVEEGTQRLALGEAERLRLELAQGELRSQCDSIVLLSFPGDEKHLGGCLAAGRGFFHIDPYGRAEACPFSPHSDRSLTDCTLLEALESPFFKRLQLEELVGGAHDGGCALFKHREKVESLLAGGA